MIQVLVIAAVALGLSAAHKREREQAAKAGRNPRTEAALRRMPPHLRARAEAKLRARAAGSRGSLPVAPRRATAGRLPTRPGIDCRKLPWLPDEVDRIIFLALDDGERDCARIVPGVLRAVYPVTPDGRDIPWPSVPGDGPAVRMLEERVKIRCRRHLAALEDMAADESYG